MGWRCKNGGGDERTLEVVEGSVGRLVPDKLVRFLQQVVQRESLFSKPADEPTQGRQAAGEFLDFLDVPCPSHVVDGGYLLRVGLDPLCRHEEAE